MKFNKEQFLDKLKRAYEMEEVMASVLLDITGSDVYSKDIPFKDQEEITKALLQIKSDTLNHKNIVRSLIQKFKGNQDE